MRRVLLTVAGTVALLLAAAGAVLPILPTTPFVLVGAGCFGASQPALYRRLAHTRYFGEYIRAWREKTGISARARVVGLLWLWGALGVSAALCGSWPIRGGLAAVGILVSIHILTIRRSGP